MSNKIITENQIPGSDAWQITDAAHGEIEGYILPVSVQPGGNVDIYVRTTPPTTFSLEVFRLGWYGGLGARRVENVENLTAAPQPAPVTDTANTVRCEWRSTYTLHVDPSWVSGVYLVKLKTVPGGKERYCIFVVREDRRSDLLLSLCVTTYQAYNEWGGHGFYRPSPDDPSRSKAVSFARPYGGEDDQGGLGAGNLFWWEYPMIRWLEREGYDVSYTTGLDLDTNGASLRNHRVFLSVGHDEYWTPGMRTALEDALAQGVSAAFLGANNVYWRVQLKDGGKTMSCDKDPAKDLWRTWVDPSTNKTKPEQLLMGIMWDSWFVWPTYDMKFCNVNTWPFTGTSMAEGDTVPGIVGYEYDVNFSNHQSPPKMFKIADSPVTAYGGRSARAEACFWTHASGAKIFSAGTCSWSWGLESSEWTFLSESFSNPHSVIKPWAGQAFAHPKLRQITANVLREQMLAGGRVCIADMSRGLGQVEAVYWENQQQSTLLNGWHDPGDILLVGDFMNLAGDQALFINQGGTDGRLLILDFASGAPTQRYVERYGQSTTLDGWHDSGDVQLVGDFMGLGHDQVLFINRGGSGGRLLILDFASGTPTQRYVERYGESTTLDGWHDSGDVQLVGDFMGLGHDQVLFLNRGGSGGRLLILDFASGTPTQRYVERYGQSTTLDGWHDSGDIQLVGDFMGLGHDQVLFINRGGSGGRLLILDFASGTPTQRYVERYGQSTALNGWLDGNDRQFVGDFMGNGHAQILFVNRGDGARCMVWDVSSGSPRVPYWDDRPGDPWPGPWFDRSALAVVGDFGKRGRSQLLLLAR